MILEARVLSWGMDGLSSGRVSLIVETDDPEKPLLLRNYEVTSPEILKTIYDCLMINQKIYLRVDHEND